MDATVISTSLPAIAADVGTTPVSLKLAFTAYYVALAIFVPLSAWFSERFGARNILRLSMVVFVCGSIGCALSASLPAFVCARFIEGIGGALMAPVARFALFRATPRAQLVQATSWLTIPAVAAPMLGPPLGGFLTTFVSWHWIFLINLPMALLGILLIGRYLPDLPLMPSGRLDLRGLLLLGIALSGLVFGASLISMPVLERWIAWACIGVGVGAGAAYGLHARRAENPILDPRIFREPTFRATTIGSSVMLLGCSALPYLTALMLQLGFGMTAFAAGLLTFSGAVGALAAKFVVTRLFSVVGFRRTMIYSALLAGLGIGMKATLMPSVPAVLIILLLFINGLVRSVYFTGHAVLTVSDMPSESAGQATAIAAVARPISSALSVALAGGVLGTLATGHGGVNTLADYHTAIALGGLICAAAALSFLPLGRDAGLANR